MDTLHALYFLKKKKEKNLTPNEIYLSEISIYFYRFVDVYNF